MSLPTHCMLINQLVTNQVIHISTGRSTLLLNAIILWISMPFAVVG